MSINKMSAKVNISIFSSKNKPKPTEVFDTYWYLAAERQSIFFRRLRGFSEDNWTKDSILKKYKFTNTYRASDRVSQYLIGNVIYKGDQSIDEVFFRTLLFKFFNRIETWELLEREIGVISFREYSFQRYDEVLRGALEQGSRIYSAAYIMPSGGKSFGNNLKHRNNLKLLEMMMADQLPYKIKDTKNMEQGFNLLLSYPSIGNFLAYQYLIDLNYSDIINFSENDFVCPGPGALSGITKCFSTFGDYNYSDLIKLMVEKQDEEISKRNINFQSLWGRKLHLIDCQNLFCEVDKYARIKHPNIPGLSNRTRIKQQFKATSQSINYWYPPKWKINKKIK